MSTRQWPEAGLKSRLYGNNFFNANKICFIHLFRVTPPSLSLLHWAQLNHMYKEIKFSNFLTFEDSIKVQKELKNKKLFSTSGVIAIFTLFCIGLIISKMSGGLLFTICMFLFMSLFIGGGMWLIKLSNKKSKKKVYEKECINRHGILKTDKIIIKTDKTTTSIQWELFEKTIELVDIIAIAKDKEYLGFSKYMFDSETDWHQAKKLILSKFAQQPLAR